MTTQSIQEAFEKWRDEHPALLAGSNSWTETQVHNAFLDGFLIGHNEAKRAALASIAKALAPHASSVSIDLQDLHEPA